MRTDLGERDYTLLALAGLLVALVILVDEGYGGWAIVPLACGALGVLVPGTVGSPFVLLVLLVMLTGKSWFVGLGRDPLMEDTPLSVLIFAMAVFAYVAAHARLLTIRRYAVPPDARRGLKAPSGRVAGRWLLPAEPTRRSASALPPGEFWALGASVPAFVLVAYLLWLRVALDQTPNALDVPPELWRLLVIIWAGVVALALVYTMTSYLGRFNAGREESLMYLQDQLWNATRGEQRRINSWRTWARLRRERKEQGR